MSSNANATYKNGSVEYLPRNGSTTHANCRRSTSSRTTAHVKALSARSHRTTEVANCYCANATRSHAAPNRQTLKAERYDTDHRRTCEYLNLTPYDIYDAVSGYLKLHSSFSLRVNGSHSGLGIHREAIGGRNGARQHLKRSPPNGYSCVPLEHCSRSPIHSLRAPTEAYTLETVAAITSPPPVQSLCWRAETPR